ncbi:hypothetical protein CVT24_007052 [Panaeolus cyanescens]|uniref:F-box domain-containing protein n=1 Tax=Panaeolus cyanescens TaxID=181874 RepID=A0A409VJQ1_9AGAR|nr:hypothetical protein CVT24_007052 [Panaeolus cyanescens]
MTPHIPNDILGEIINVLGEESNFETVKSIAQLSSFCLHQSRQHLFRTIEVTTSQSDSESSGRTLQDFISFFTGHSELLQYIHHFVLHILYPLPSSSAQLLKPSDQAQCSTILLKASNLNSLSLAIDMDQTQAYLPSFSPSWTGSSFEPIRALVGDLLFAHRSLSSLSLTRVSDFPIEVLSFAPYLRSLSLDNSQLIVSSEGLDKARKVNGNDSHETLLSVFSDSFAYPCLESLRIDVMQSSHFTDSATSLVRRVSEPDGQFILPLSNLKKLYLGLEDSPQCFKAVSDMLQAQAIDSLELLSIRIPCPMKGKSTSILNSPEKTRAYT